MRPHLSRREFVAATTAALAATRLPAALAPHAKLANDPLRPQCHFLPPGNWMNDPNGPIVWRGKVHLFYQVNPHGADWGDISWGHAVSTDMVHWKHLPVALTPEPGYPDSYGVFSGSCIADGDRCLAFYTAVEQVSDSKIATLHGDKELREQQTVAISTDPDLLVWTKQKQALITTPPLPNIAGFRDPSAWKQGSAAAEKPAWYMTVGSGQIDGEGTVLLYKATIPAGPKADWQYMHPLISAPGNGKKTPDTVDAGTMWECPDLFELDGHHVLLYSTERKVYWITGHLNKDMRFEPKQRGLLDSGAYYAPKSMTGPKGERILWGWIPERRPKEQYIAAGWSGAMSFPRVLHVDSDGNLLQSLPSAIDGLLTGTKQAATGKQQAITLPSLAAKIHATLPASGDASFAVTAGGKPLLSVRRVVAEHIEINGETIMAPLSDGVTAYLDGSVTEIFFGNHTVHTVRAYPQLAPNDTLSVAASGPAMVTAQAMNPVSANRLTA